MASQNPVTTASVLLNVHHLTEKADPLIHNPNVVTKDNRLESKQGKSRRSTFVKFPARLWPCVDLYWGKNEQERKELVVLLAADSAVCVIRPQEPYRNQDQLLYVIRSFFIIKPLHFLSHEIKSFFSETTIKPPLLVHVEYAVVLQYNTLRLKSLAFHCFCRVQPHHHEKGLL